MTSYVVGQFITQEQDPRSKNYIICTGKDNALRILKLHSEDLLSSSSSSLRTTSQPSIIPDKVKISINPLAKLKLAEKENKQNSKRKSEICPSDYVCVECNTVNEAIQIWTNGIFYDQRSTYKFIALEPTNLKGEEKSDNKRRKLELIQSDDIFARFSQLTNMFDQEFRFEANLNLKQYDFRFFLYLNKKGWLWIDTHVQQRKIMSNFESEFVPRDVDDRFDVQEHLYSSLLSIQSYVFQKLISHLSQNENHKTLSRRTERKIQILLFSSERTQEIDFYPTFPSIISHPTLLLLKTRYFANSHHSYFKILPTLCHITHLSWEEEQKQQTSLSLLPSFASSRNIFQGETSNLIYYLLQKEWYEKQGQFSTEKNVELHLLYQSRRKFSKNRLLAPHLFKTRTILKNPIDEHKEEEKEKIHDLLSTYRFFNQDPSMQFVHLNNNDFIDIFLKLMNLNELELRLEYKRSSSRKQQEETDSSLQLSHCKVSLGLTSLKKKECYQNNVSLKSSIGSRLVRYISRILNLVYKYDPMKRHSIDLSEFLRENGESPENKTLLPMPKMMVKINQVRENKSEQLYTLFMNETLQERCEILDVFYLSPFFSMLRLID